MSSSILADRDVNAPAAGAQTQEKGEVKSMEYHRQMLQERLNGEQGKPTYISPSDNIMSPCTAKLSAYRSKHSMKAKPRSLFAKTSSKNLPKSGMFGEIADKETSASSSSSEEEKAL